MCVCVCVCGVVWCGVVCVWYGVYVWCGVVCVRYGVVCVWYGVVCVMCVCVWGVAQPSPSNVPLPSHQYAALPPEKARFKLVVP